MLRLRNSGENTRLNHHHYHHPRGPQRRQPHMQRSSSKYPSSSPITVHLPQLQKRANKTANQRSCLRQLFRAWDVGFISRSDENRSPIPCNPHNVGHQEKRTKNPKTTNGDANKPQQGSNGVATPTAVRKKKETK